MSDRNDYPGVSSISSHIGEFVDRDPEIDRLDGLFGAAARGVGGALLVRGEPGIGKTALLRAAGDMAQESGFAVIEATGAELEREHGLGIARSLIAGAWGLLPASRRDEVAAGAAGLARPLFDPSAPPLPLPEPEAGLFHGSYWLISAISDDRPIVLVVDDLQWCDSSSRRLLSYLARRLDGLPVVILAASRPEGEHPASDLVDLPEISLGPLSVAGVRQVAETMLGGEQSEDFVAACHRSTGGNPLFVDAVLGELLSSGVAPLPGSIDRLDPQPVVRAARAALDRLGPDANALARALATFGDGTPLYLLAEFAGLDPESATPAADSLAAARILADAADPAFRHPIVRAAVEGLVPKHERGLAHARAARLLKAAGEPPEAVADHILLAPPGTVDEARGQMRAAADSVERRGAADAAATYLERALREPGTTEDRAGDLLALGRARWNCGDPSAVALLEEAAETTADPSRRAIAVLELSQTLFRMGQARRAVARLGAELDGLEPGTEDVERSLRSQLITFADIDLAARPAVAGGLEQHVAKLGGPASPSGSLVAAHEAVESMLRGDGANRTGVLAEQALEHMAKSPGSVAPEMISLLCWILLATERYGVSRGYLEVGLREAQRAGAPTVATMIGFSLVQLLVNAGQIREAESLARSGASAMAELNPLSATFAIASLRLVAIEIDPHADSEDPVAPPPRPEEVTSQEASKWISDGTFLIAQGKLEEGSRLVLDGGRTVAAMGFSGPSPYPWRSTAALALARLGRAEEARELVEEERGLALAWGSPRTVGIALRACALLEQDAERRLAGLRDSVDVLEDSEAPLELARSLAEIGAALRRANRRADARVPLSRALDIAESCGGRVVAEQARLELRASGARPRSEQRLGVDALTPSERRIAEMASIGMSNPEIAQSLFLSRRTVESHLGSSYAKLGISGRADLSGALTE